MTRIAPGQGGVLASLAECWCRREILYFLAWRDIKVRYKQTVLGVAWAVIQPVVDMVIFTVVFNKVAGVAGFPGVPYPAFALAGLLPWMLFQGALVQSSTSVVAQSRLVTKVYFPRLLVPLSTVVSALVDFAIALVILALVLVGYDLRPGWTVLWLPAFAALTVLAALSAGLWFAALNAKYRDFHYVVPFLVRVGLFASPVAYTAADFAGKLGLSPGWQWLYGLNPMTGVLEGFRWALFGRGELWTGPMLVSVGMVAALLAGGLFYFRRMEREFADLL